MRWWRRPLVTGAALAVIGFALAIVATRHGPRLSPDSITYLSVADHLRHGRGLTDFTGEPFTVFPPVYPVVLSVFGSSLTWARLVNTVSFAVSLVLLHRLLTPRVRPWVAAAAVLAIAVCQGEVVVTASTFSEPLFVALSLAVLLVLDRPHLSTRRAAAAGALAGVGFLTRYAGVGLVATVVLVIVFAALGREGERVRSFRPVAAGAAAAVLVSGAWLVRNVVAAGQAMGPRWSGGTSESWQVLLWRPFEAIGTNLVGDALDAARVAGVVATVVFVAAIVVMVRRRPWSPVDLGMVLLGGTSFVVPVVARAMTASDVSPRVVSPALPCLAYAVAVLVDAVVPRRRVCMPRWRSVVGMMTAALVVAGLAWSAWQGAAESVRFARLPGSGDRNVYSPALHEAIDALPADTVVLTNNPWGVWWVHRREPTLMAFVRPRAGNSHLPISGDELLRRVCAGPVALAWFDSLQNAGDGPFERRPDLSELVDLSETRSVSHGQLYLLTPVDPTSCPDA